MEPITIEQLSALLSTSADPALLDDLNAQLAAAEMLRQYAPDAYTQAGRVVVPNIAGSISAMFVRGNAKRDAERARRERDQILNNQREAARSYFEALFPGQVEPNVVTEPIAAPQINMPTPTFTDRLTALLRKSMG